MRHHAAASWLSCGIPICRYKTQLHIFLNRLNQCIKLIIHQHRSYILRAAAAGSFSFAEFLHSAGFSPQTEMLLPLIRTHCHLKATAGIIGWSFTFLMTVLEHVSMPSVLMLMLTVQPLNTATLHTGFWPRAILKIKNKAHWLFTQLSLWWICM